MKKKFSKAWRESKQPRKQRKYRANAPLHLRKKFLNAHLSKELRKTYKRRAFPLRKGDEVLVLRGSFRKKRAKVASIDLKRGRVALEGVQRTRKDGTKVNVWFSPSNLMIMNLNLDDKKRMQALKRVENKNQEVKMKPTESKKSEGKNAPDKS
ncbi:50S ribosomal protein L24 [Candidatus Pacearchaeota archaeon]|nr:MAG: 50S ribosomal protein L24 [Candidatus Pacearchaeota archaeon]